MAAKKKIRPGTILYVCKTYLCMYICVLFPLWGQNRLDPVEQELQVVESYPVWLLGIELWSFLRATSS